jgi:hypothetical protein
MPIPFTQYLRPDGRQKGVNIARPPEVEALASSLIAKHCVFEVEELTTGEASLTCECVDPEDGDSVTLAIEVVPNGPEVPAAVDRLVQAAAKQLAVLTA